MDQGDFAFPFSITLDLWLVIERGYSFHLLQIEVDQIWVQKFVGVLVTIKGHFFLFWAKSQYFRNM